MLKEVVVIVWVEERLDSIWTLECSNGNVLLGIRKKLWTTAFCTRKSIVISEASTNGIEANVSTMLEEVVQIVSVDERLDSIWTLECSNGNVLCGIRKKIVNNSLLHKEINPHFWGCYRWYSSESFNDIKRSRRHCLSRRTAWFHLNCAQWQWKLTLRIP